MNSQAPTLWVFILGVLSVVDISSCDHSLMNYTKSRDYLLDYMHISDCSSGQCNWKKFVFKRGSSVFGRPGTSRQPHLSPSSDLHGTPGQRNIRRRDSVATPSDGADTPGRPRGPPNPNPPVSADIPDPPSIPATPCPPVGADTPGKSSVPADLNLPCGAQPDTLGQPHLLPLSPSSDIHATPEQRHLRRRDDSVPPGDLPGSPDTADPPTTAGTPSNAGTPGGPAPPASQPSEPSVPHALVSKQLFEPFLKSTKCRCLSVVEFKKYTCWSSSEIPAELAGLTLCALPMCKYFVLRWLGFKVPRKCCRCIAPDSPAKTRKPSSANQPQPTIRYR